MLRHRSSAVFHAGPKKAWSRGALIAAIVSIGHPGGPALASEKKPPFRSWTTLRTSGVVLQKLDFSCGAAALSTIATYYLAKPISEEQALRIVRARYSAGEWKDKKSNGLSMEDLIYMAENLGLKAEGVRIGLDALTKLKSPVIVHLDKGEFQHFSVLRGIRGMTAYLADPITGKQAVSLGQFLDQFTGAALAVWDSATPSPDEFPLKIQTEEQTNDRGHDLLRSQFYSRQALMPKAF